MKGFNVRLQVVTAMQWSDSLFSFQQSLVGAGTLKCVSATVVPVLARRRVLCWQSCRSPLIQGRDNPLQLLSVVCLSFSLLLVCGSAQRWSVEREVILQQSGGRALGRGSCLPSGTIQASIYIHWGFETSHGWWVSRDTMPWKKARVYVCISLMSPY